MFCYTSLFFCSTSPFGVFLDGSWKDTAYLKIFEGPCENSIQEKINWKWCFINDKWNYLKSTMLWIWLRNEQSEKKSWRMMNIFLFSIMKFHWFVFDVFINSIDFIVHQLLSIQFNTTSFDKHIPIFFNDCFLFFLCCFIHSTILKKLQKNMSSSFHSKKYSIGKGKESFIQIDLV